MTLQLANATETAYEASFAAAMSRLAGGVAIVTCSLDGRPWGTTVTAVASVSADPPIVLVSLASTGTSAEAIGATGRFGVSILDGSQHEVARHCSAPGRPKFLERFVLPRPGRRTSPMVSGALAHLDCQLVDSLEVADHTVFFGRVREARTAPGGEPLVYFGRGYRALADQPIERHARGARP
jgi:flavin reductase (DIM6/NTAB) family NADH-FMN oxidoreductase RutF